jgi:hypothetical protein
MIDEYGAFWWNENWQGKPKYLEKTCPSAILSTTIPTRPDLGSNSGPPQWEASDCLSYGMACGTVAMPTELSWLQNAMENNKNL